MRSFQLSYENVILVMILNLFLIAYKYEVMMHLTSLSPHCCFASSHNCNAICTKTDAKNESKIITIVICVPARRQMPSNRRPYPPVTSPADASSTAASSPASGGRSVMIEGSSTLERAKRPAGHGRWRRSGRCDRGKKNVRGE